MSETKLHHEALRWLATAEDDLRAAEHLAGAGMHAHACFLCQQAGEKALKAAWYAAGEDPWGHSLLKLLQDMPRGASFDRFRNLVDQAAMLDKFYIPTRYPNGLPDLTPAASYRPVDSQGGIAAAKTIIAAARERLS